MKTIDFKCKLCGRPGTSQCADDYDDVGDAQKLVPMLCHDACYDLWSRRRGIEDKIYRVCVNLVQGGSAGKAAAAEKAKNLLRLLTQKYAAWARDAAHKENIIWDEEIVSLLFDKPEDWSLILKNYRRHCEQLWKEQRYEQATL